MLCWKERRSCCHCKCFIEHLKKLKAVKSLYWVLYPLPEVLRKRLFCIKETTFDVLLKMMQYWYETHILMLFFYFLQCLHQSGNLSNCCTHRHSRKQTHKSKSITRLECFIKPQNAIFYLCEKHFAQRNANENLSREIVKKYFGFYGESLATHLFENINLRIPMFFLYQIVSYMIYIKLKISYILPLMQQSN